MFFLLETTTLYANTTTLEVDLNKSIEIAFKNSFELKSLSHALEAAKHDINQAKDDFLPSFETDYSYTHLDEEVAMNFMGMKYTITPQDLVRWSISVKQPLFTGFALTSAYRLANIKLKKVLVAIEKTRIALAFKVKKAYIDVLMAKKALDVAREYVRLINAHKKIAESFYERGLVPKIDVLRAEVQLAEAREKEVTRENAYLLALTAFRLLLHIPENQEVRLTELPPFSGYKIPYALAVDRGFKRRPELKDMDLVEKMLIEEKNLVKKDLYPHVYLAGTYMKEEQDPDIKGALGPDDSDQWNITLMLNWTFWQWGKTLEGIKAVNERLKEQHVKIGLIKDNIRLQIKRSLLALREAEINIEVAKRSLVHAEENLSLTQARYKEHLSTSTDVLDAQTLLSQAKLNYYIAFYKKHYAFAELQYAMGEF